jgi:4-aminobutyrate aminotransferase-like enzyme
MPDRACLSKRLQKRLRETPPLKRGDIFTTNLTQRGKVITSGSGATLITDEGQKIIDFSSQTVNCSLGQNDAWVKANLKAYLETDIPSFLSSRLHTAVYRSYPQRLIDLGIGGIKSPRINHRQCNGSDVCELALKAAHEKAGCRKYIAAFGGGYHGQSLANYFVSDKQKHLRFLCEQSQVLFFPAPEHAEENEVRLSAADAQTLEQIEVRANEIYGIIIEPVQVNNNVTCVSKFFLKGLRKLCDKYDICLIFDEVQTGFGWLGNLSAAEAYNVVPDIAAFSKGITSGFGALAVMVSSERYSHLPYGCGEKTNGADIRSLIAAYAVLDRLVGIDDQSLLLGFEELDCHEMSEGLMKQVPQTAQKIRLYLESIQQELPHLVSGIRSRGMIFGIKIASKVNSLSPHKTSEIVARGLQQGLFLRQSGDWLIIKPPLVITDHEISEGCDILRDILKSI